MITQVYIYIYIYIHRRTVVVIVVVFVSHLTSLNITLAVCVHPYLVDLSVCLTHLSRHPCETGTMSKRPPSYCSQKSACQTRPTKFWSVTKINHVGRAVDSKGRNKRSGRRGIDLFTIDRWTLVFGFMLQKTLSGLWFQSIDITHARAHTHTHTHTYLVTDKQTKGEGKKLVISYY